MSVRRTHRNDETTEPRDAGTGQAADRYGTRTDERSGTAPGLHADERYAHRDTDARPDAVVEHPGYTRTPHDGEAREKFGGLNWGSSFFGWLVAIAVAILLTSVVGAVVAAIGSTQSVTQSDAQRRAGDIGLAAAIVLAVVLAVGYYLGGYVAGRMSRFDGVRQGLGVWVIGVVVTVVALVLGAIFGRQYNVLDRVNLPDLPISTDQLGWGAAITAVAVLVVTLVAALLGGTVGHRYHNRVDRAAWGS